MPPSSIATDAWNNHDVDAVLEFFTDDGVYEDVTVARVNRGKAEIRAFVEETFAVFPDFQVADGPVILDPSGRYGLEWTMSGTHEGDTAIPATHKRFSLRGASGASSRATRSSGTPTTGTWRSSSPRSGSCHSPRPPRQQTRGPVRYPEAGLVLIDPIRLPRPMPGAHLAASMVEAMHDGEPGSSQAGSGERHRRRSRRSRSSRRRCCGCGCWRVAAPRSISRSGSAWPSGA